MHRIKFSRRHFLSAAASFAMPLPPTKASALNDVPPHEQLADLARKKGVPFGSAIESSDLRHDDLKSLYRAHCTSLTPRNALKWTATEKATGKFNFSEGDKIVAFAKANQMAVYGHTLVWHRAPSYVTNIKSANQLQTMMQRHIETQMHHFSGRVRSWDVINEPLEYDSSELRQSVFSRLLGEEYISSAFKIAKRADPKALLVINETHLEKQGMVFDKKREAFLALLDRTLDSGAHIDAVGIQGHFRPGLDAFSAGAFGEFCSELRRRGVGIYITELDASCQFVSRDPNFTPEDYGVIFEDVISSAATNAKLMGVTVWGMAEKYATPVAREVTPSCSKRINLYDEKDAPRATLSAILRAYKAMPDI